MIFGKGHKKIDAEKLNDLIKEIIPDGQPNGMGG